jgi:hypothetical protein
MSKHKISIDDFKDNYTSIVEIAGAYGKGENKTLKVHTGFITKNVVFCLYKDNKLCNYTFDLQSAIDIYNSI